MPKGGLRVIDPDNNEMCSTQETALNWSQQGTTAMPALRDANGQVLGTIVEDNLNGGGQPMEVFNPSLKRLVYIDFETPSITSQSKIGLFQEPLYAADDCSGQAYEHVNSYVKVKTLLFRLSTSNVSSNTYAIVSDNASVSHFAALSIRRTNGSCQTFGATDLIDDYVPLTTVTLPFTLPLAMPLKF